MATNIKIADSEKKEEKIIVVLRLCKSDDGCILKREEGIKYSSQLRMAVFSTRMVPWRLASVAAA